MDKLRIQASQAYHEANNFADLSDYADKKSLEYSFEGFGEQYAAARNVNLTFACELYLKSLYLAKGNTPPKKHQLKQLFDGLEEELKQKIETNYKAYHATFVPLTVLLEKHDDSFEKWRYYYELNSFDELSSFDPDTSELDSTNSKIIEYHITDMAHLEQALQRVCIEVLELQE